MSKHEGCEARIADLQERLDDSQREQAETAGGAGRIAATHHAFRRLVVVHIADWLRHDEFAVRSAAEELMARLDVVEAGVTAEVKDLLRGAR
jgi:hypothetical protein